jgi:hypothetical protein
LAVEVTDHEMRAGILRFLYYTTVKQDIPVSLSEPERLRRTMHLALIPFFAQRFMESEQTPFLLRETGITESRIFQYRRALAKLLPVSRPN